MNDKPLSGVRVLDFTRLLPGPFCSLLLADSGAEVLKLEPPLKGDPTRWLPPLVGDAGAAFQALNRGKKSVALSLSHEKSREILLRLAATCDILMESFRPGVMDQLRLGYERVSAVAPRLIYCSISGYGQRGPYRDKAGHDLNYQALAGILGATGPVGGPPEMPAVQSADLAGGAFHAAYAIAAALFQRERTGKGQYLDISMTSGALSLMIMPLADHLADARGTPPGKLLLNGGLVNYRTYLTRDGKALALAALEAQFWTKFLSRIGRDDLAALAQREDGIEKAAKDLQAVFAERTRDEWMAFLADLDVCCEPVLDADETVHHPVHLASGMIRDMRLQDGGTMPVVVSPVPFLGPFDPDRPLKGAPALGADTARVLEAIGVMPDELAALRKEGVCG